MVNQDGAVAVVLVGCVAFTSRQAWPLSECQV